MILLSLVVLGGEVLQCHTQVLRFSKWYLVYEELIAGLLMKGTMNDLCPHLDDVTPLKFFI